MENLQLGRFVTHGFLLYEYVPDEDRHRLVGVVDCSETQGICPLTKKGADELEADEFFETGTVAHWVTDIPYRPLDFDGVGGVI